jgi:hypothetical protein
MQTNLIHEAAHLAEAQKRWIQAGARWGHVAKGVVYCLIGILAIKQAAGAGGQLGGSKQAVQYLGSQPFGQVLLVLVGVGLFGYAGWRIVMGVADTEREGTDPKAVAKRASYIVSGVANAAVGVTALRLAWGSSASEGGPKMLTAEVMQHVLGQVAVGASGVILAGYGIYQIYCAYVGSFAEHLETRSLSREFERVVRILGRAGYGARGVIFVIVGVALVNTALDHDPNQAKGLGEALHSIASSAHGQVLLVFVAAGLLAYGAYLVTIARHLRVRVR